MSPVDKHPTPDFTVVASGVNWTNSAHECPVLLCPEPEGGFSVHALTLPGAVSQGETEQEALANIKEAIEGAIAVYKESGVPIPWGAVIVDPVPTGAMERRVSVNA